MPGLQLDPVLLHEFRELPALLDAVETVEQTLGRVADLCSRALRGAVGAGVALRHGTMWATTTTPSWLAAVDQHQYATGVGPALDAVNRSAPVLIADLADEDRWGSFGPVAAEHGVRSLLVSPLGVRGRVIGALSLYGVAPGTFDADSVALTESFTAHAGAALLNADMQEASRRQAEHLRRAMESRAAIEQAKGVVMAREGCSADAAFGLLRQASQTQHLKLHEVATRLLSSVRDPAVP